MLRQIVRGDALQRPYPAGQRSVESYFGVLRGSVAGRPLRAVIRRVVLESPDGLARALDYTATVPRMRWSMAGVSIS